MNDTILEIEGLRTWFHTEDGIVKAVDDIDLKLEVGRTLGVVGAALPERGERDCSLSC